MEATENIEESTRIVLEEYRELLKNYCLMDDLYMTKFFDGDKKGIQLVLRIILDDPDLIVEEVHTQKFIANLLERSVRLDIVAVDGKGRRFNVEVQCDNGGAVPQRTRFNGSSLDVDMLGKNEPFTNLPDAYVIFITKKDVLKGGKPLYRIQRTILDMDNKPFGDGSYIIYVNGEIRDGTKLGRLMHDFFCSNPNEMHYEVLRERAKYFKQDKEGVGTMGGSYAEISAKERAEGRKEGLARGLKQGTLRSLRNLIANVDMTVEQAMAAIGVPEEERAVYRKELET